MQRQRSQRSSAATLTNKMIRAIHHNVRIRLLAALLAASLVQLSLPSSLLWATRTLCLWDAAMLCFLGLTWVAMARSKPEVMRWRALQEDEGRVVILSLITAAACASLLAIFFVLKSSKDTPPAQLQLHLGLAITTIVSSWLLVHTIFASHYAFDYYRNDPTSEQAEGLDFPGDRQPDYWDFLYYSFTVGMTSQVSDVQVNSRSMRRLTLLHGVLSFFFNTTILAMSINIIAGLLGAT